MKLRSLLVWSSVLVVGAATVGCVVESRTSETCYEDDWGDVTCYETVPAPSSSGTTTTAPPNQPSASPLTATIDADRTLDAQPGAGVGLMVEYGAGGAWALATTCDTTTSGQACDFDVFATVDTSGTISNVASQGLEAGDVATRTDAVVHFAARTTTTEKSVRFDATPGSSVAIEVWLDGALEGRYVYWVGSGVVHAGAPTNPIVLQPSKP